MAEIHHIGAGRDTTEPCAETIERLEMLLDQAKSGEIRGIVYALELQNGATVAYGNVGEISFSQIGALEAVKSKLARWFEGE